MYLSALRLVPYRLQSHCTKSHIQKYNDIRTTFLIRVKGPYERKPARTAGVYVMRTFPGT